jgi:acyl-CoA reductase-like NAD-dependent aldehyde dehydrogenase
MSTAVEMSASAKSTRPSESAELDKAVDAVKAEARAFARMPIADKVKLLRETMETVASAGEAWASAGTAAKGLPPDNGEEWLMGPVPVMRNLRLVAATLERVMSGAPAIPPERVRTRPDGRVEVDVFPTDSFDKVLTSGIRAYQLMQPGVDKGSVRAASFYQRKDPEGGVALILGAGNVSSIPAMDALTKSIAEGFVTVVKVNPVNEWVGPFLERAFQPFIAKNLMRVVYGGAEAGKHLVEHPAIDDVHITGSNHTHDLIVWGPPGPEREERMRSDAPLLKKRITSELGNVSPVAVVPAELTAAELDNLGENIAGMVIHNASFNCNAAKMLILQQGWPQRDALMKKIASVFERTPTRDAFYPGAHDRYRRLVEGREALRYGAADGRKLPWTIIPGVDATKASDPLFSTEPFCALISQTALAADGPVAFLEAATRFMNQTLWGTLNAMIVLPPALEARADVNAALDRAIVELEYGTVAVNHWPGVVYGLVAPAWGGHPSATLKDIQSGIGWVHNTHLLEGIDKTVLRAPYKIAPKPVWFPGHKRVPGIGRRLLEFERAPSWMKVPGIALTALGG